MKEGRIDWATASLKGSGNAQKKDNSPNDHFLSFNYNKLSKWFCPETMLESFQLKSDSF